jgi:hypothetical protein
MKEKEETQEKIHEKFKELNKKSAKHDRFDLEECIQDIWQTEVDIGTVIYSIRDAHVEAKMTEDEILNLLRGLKGIHSARTQKLQDVFEEFVQSQHDNFWEAYSFHAYRHELTNHKKTLRGLGFDYGSHEAKERQKEKKLKEKNDKL